MCVQVCLYPDRNTQNLSLPRVSKDPDCSKTLWSGRRTVCLVSEIELTIFKFEKQSLFIYLFISSEYN
jgi:hypothetical protein